MLHLIGIFQALVERGLIYSLVVMSVYITSRIIKFDDLTTEGSFGIGGALTATCLLWGCNPILVTLGALAAGGLTGFATGFLHTRLGMNNLMSGIVVTTGLFSVTLKLAGSNATIMGQPTIFSLMPAMVSDYSIILLLTIIAVAAVMIIKQFLSTEIGLLIRAVGDNPQMLTSLGKRINLYKITALILGNMLTALAGSLFVQYVGYFSIWANVGILISALAGLILAELISNSFGISLIIGSIIYQLIITFTFELEIGQEWNKLITALCIVLLLSLTSRSTAAKRRG